MTTSISRPEGSLQLDQSAEARVAKSSEPAVVRVPHTLASRFIFLNVCLAIVLSALAYGTVHYWALGLFALGAFGTLVLWAVDSWRLGVLRISRNPLQLPLIGMFLLGLVQLLPLRQPAAAELLTSPSVKALSLDPYSTRLVLVQVAALTIYFAATLVFTDTPHRLRVLVRLITIFGFCLAIFGLTQSFASPNKIYWVRELAQATAFGPFINRHHFAGYMEMTIALPLGLLFSGSLEKEKRYVYFFAVGLMGVALVMTGSRGGIVSLLAQILFLVSFAGFRKRRKREELPTAKRIRNAGLRAALGLVLVVSLLIGVVLLGGEGALSRVTGSLDTDDPTMGRTHFWTITLDIIKEHPVVGIGLGAFGVVYTRYDSRNGLYRLEQAHNDYLQVLSDGGIVGAVLGLSFVVLLFWIGFARRESRDEFRSGVALGALAGCFAVLVHSFFDFTLHTTSNALLFLVLAALATIDGRVEHVRSRRRRRHRHESPSPILIRPHEAN